MPRDFLPAAHRRSLTPAYDLLCRAVGLGPRLRAFELAKLTRFSPRAVLEVGCGTGELLVRLAGAFPLAEVAGLDVDPDAIAICRRKLHDAGLDGTGLVAGRAESLPFPDGSFDLVVASLVVHHLTTAQKRAAFAEWRRVVRSTGMVVLFDFDAPRSLVGRWLTWPLRFDLLEHTGDHFAGRIPALVSRAGFDVVPVGRYGGIVSAWDAIPGPQGE